MQRAPGRRRRLRAEPPRRAAAGARLTVAVEAGRVETGPFELAQVPAAGRDAEDRRLAPAPRLRAHGAAVEERVVDAERPALRVERDVLPVGEQEEAVVEFRADVVGPLAGEKIVVDGEALDILRTRTSISRLIASNI